jgi:hypothetical protein
VTLLLTCVTDRFAVQASDRRLTLVNGDVAEDHANKATMLCRQATFAYTGLAQCSVAERTDELLLRCLARQIAPFDRLLAGLGTDAARAIRNLPLRVPADQRRAVRRTSFVGAGFVGMKNPGQLGRAASSDELHPFLAVVSNAQDLTEQWRPVADQEFATYLRYLDEGEPFLLHAAGQPFTGTSRIALERMLRRSLGRVNHPESLARLMARAVRAVAANNPRVGPNVMCTMIRRTKVTTPTGSFTGGLIPLTTRIMAREADYFKWPRGPDGEDSQWIYYPSDPTALRHYGPNWTCGGLEAKGVEVNQSSSVHPGLAATDSIYCLGGQCPACCAVRIRRLTTIQVARE